MYVFVEATTIEDAWYQLLRNLIDKGIEYKITAGSYAGSKRLEYGFAAGIIKTPHVRPLAPVIPATCQAPTPTTDEKIEEYFANYLMDANLAPNEHYRYATWINGKFSENLFDYCNKIKCKHLKPYAEDSLCITEYICGINQMKIAKENHDYDSKIYALKPVENIKCPLDMPQTPIEWVIHHFLKKGYGTNHCCINIGNIDSNLAYEWPYETEEERGTSPCLRVIDFKIKENKLITTVFFRSWDLYSAFPENIGGIVLLNEYVAEHLPDVEPGPICFSSTGLHCYDFQIDFVRARLYDRV